MNIRACAKENSMILLYSVALIQDQIQVVNYSLHLQTSYLFSFICFPQMDRFLPVLNLWKPSLHFCKVLSIFNVKLKVRQILQILNRIFQFFKTIF